MNQTTDCMRSQGGQANSEAVSGESVVALSFLTQQFHRVQARLKTRKAFGGKRQKVVAALFDTASTGEADFYDMPAYLRKQIHRQDFDNRCRAAAYADRVRAHIQGAAA
ncbi:hypothetical protein [Marinobacter sp.]|uniref:hypothetical protein n=1 Tax=Marinobacter sp. TaxID=50741 RepID=UPI0035C7367D